MNQPKYSISEADKQTMIRILRELSEYTDDAVRIGQKLNSENKHETPTERLRKTAGLKQTGKYMVAAAKQGVVKGPEAIRYSNAGTALMGKAPRAENATKAIKELVPIKEYTYPAGFDDLAKFKNTNPIPLRNKIQYGDLTRATTVDTLDQSHARNAHEMLRLKSHTGVAKSTNKATENMAKAMTDDNIRRLRSGVHKPKAVEAPVPVAASTTSTSSTSQASSDNFPFPRLRNRLRGLMQGKPATA